MCIYIYIYATTYMRTSHAPARLLRGLLRLWDVLLTLCQEPCVGRLSDVSGISSERLVSVGCR